MCIYLYITIIVIREESWIYGVGDMSGVGGTRDNENIYSCIKFKKKVL